MAFKEHPDISDIWVSRAVIKRFFLWDMNHLIRHVEPRAVIYNDLTICSDEIASLTLASHQGPSFVVDVLISKDLKGVTDALVGRGSVLSYQQNQALDKGSLRKSDTRLELSVRSSQRDVWDGMTSENIDSPDSWISYSLIERLEMVDKLQLEHSTKRMILNNMKLYSIGMIELKWIRDDFCSGQSVFYVTQNLEGPAAIADALLGHEVLELMKAQA